MYRFNVDGKMFTVTFIESEKANGYNVKATHGMFGLEFYFNSATPPEVNDACYYLNHMIAHVTK